MVGQKKSKQPYDQYEHYIALVVDPFTGKILKRSSANLRHARDGMLSEAVTKLDQFLRHNSSSGDFRQSSLSH